MESPPSTSTWSEPFILSDDSGLLLTGSSVSSGSMSGESQSFGRYATDLQDSDCEDKSFSQADSLDGMSDIMCGENFNTLKKGPHWFDLTDCKRNTPIEPPLEFQDKPNVLLYEAIANTLIPRIIDEAIRFYCRTIVQCVENIPKSFGNRQVLASTSYWSSDFLPFTSPPSSRRSLVSSRLSSSHNSLSVPAAHKVDDSSFITQAVSHDVLVSGQISDIYNVPFDSDMYAVPVDVIRQPLKPRRNQQHKKRRRNTSSCCREFDDHLNRTHQNSVRKYYIDYTKCKRVIESSEGISKRHSVACSSAHVEGESVHMTLQEVRHYLQTLYSSSSDSSVYKDREIKNVNSVTNNNNNNSNNKYVSDNKMILSTKKNDFYHQNSAQKFKKNLFLINIKNKRIKDTCESINEEQILTAKPSKSKKSMARMSSLKQTLCNIFRFRRFVSPDRKRTSIEDKQSLKEKEAIKPPTNRALPPLPLKKIKNEESVLDFTTSIQKVKDYGWYWGPISCEAAEKILSNEPDGSFIVRDSSDDHYIFSLTFKLNNSVRHVRIEHGQGNFSFGSCTKFKSQTIVEFIENAVEHSRSGRYLFFLHRRPVIGPVRVQLLHPVSRFKQIQSLQHMCRFVILKLVRRDLLPDLPLPRRMVDYLNTPHYYSEQLCDLEEQDRTSEPSLDSQDIYENSNNNNIITNEPINNNVDQVFEPSSPIFANNTRQS